MAPRGVIRPWLITGALLTLAACGQDTPTSVNGVPARVLAARLGQAVDIQLQTIGPGEYRTPPTVSAPTVQFVSVALVAPAVPAGVTQRFRFQAVAPGRAVITFQHTVGTELVDTIDVQ
jgi:hypothetical protein